MKYIWYFSLSFCVLLFCIKYNCIQGLMSKICTQNLVFSHKSNHFIYNLPVSKLLLLFVVILLYCCYNIKIYVLTMSLWHGRVSGKGVDWQSPASSPLFTGLNFTKVEEDLSGSCGENSLKVKHVDIKAFFPLWWHLEAQQIFCVCVCVHVRMCTHVSRQCVGEALASHGQHNNWTSKATNISSVILWRESSCKVNGALIGQDPADEWGIKEDEEGNEDELRVLRLEQGKSGWEKDKHR